MRTPAIDHRAIIEQVLHAVGRGSSCWIPAECGNSLPLQDRLAHELHSMGTRVVAVDLAGLSAQELPVMLLQSLGMTFDDSLQHANWQRFAEFVDGCRSSDKRLAFLWNASLTSDDLAPTVYRVMQMTRRIAVQVLFGGEDAGWEQLADQQGMTFNSSLS